MSTKPNTMTRTAETEARLVTAARDQLVRLGAEGISMRAIAADAGVTAGAIYRHFPNKEALLARVIHESFERFEKSLWRGISSLPVGSLERLQSLGEAYISFAINSREDFRILFAVRSDNPTKLSDLPSRAGYGILKQCVVEAIEVGQIRRDDPALISIFLWSRVHGAAMLLFACDLSEEMAALKGRNGPLELFHRTTKLLFEGLRPEA